MMLDFPALVLEINRVNPALCQRIGSQEIWFSPRMPIVPKPFLQDPKVNYRLARWSPGGKWIAYVESRTQMIPEEGKSKMPEITGTETVWLIQPDGSNQHQVSDPIPNAFYTFLSGVSIGCEPISSIIGINWSPDGKFILIEQVRYSGEEGYQYSYYLTDITTEKTKLLITQSTNGFISWMQNGEQVLIKGETNELKILDIRNIDQVDLRIIPYTLPNAVKNNSKYSFLVYGQSPNIYGLFTFKEGKTLSDIPVRVEVWKYEIKKNSWVKAAEFSGDTWQKMKFFRNWVILCNEDAKEIKLLDPQKWVPIGVSTLPPGFKISCSTITLDYVNNQGEDWGVFSGSQDIVERGLWTFRLAPGEEVKPQRLLDPSIFPEWKYLFNYQFQP